MTRGHKIRVGNMRINPKTGKLERVHKVVAGQPRKVKEAKAKREAGKWTEKSRPLPK
jgi:hypothetical protein